MRLHIVWYRADVQLWWSWSSELRTKAEAPSLYGVCAHITHAKYSTEKTPSMDSAITINQLYTHAHALYRRWRYRVSSVHIKNLLIFNIPAREPCCACNISSVCHFRFVLQSESPQVS